MSRTAGVSAQWSFDRQLSEDLLHERDPCTIHEGENLASHALAFTRFVSILDSGGVGRVWSLKRQFGRGLLRLPLSCIYIFCLRDEHVWTLTIFQSLSANGQL